VNVRQVWQDVALGSRPRKCEIMRTDKNQDVVLGILLLELLGKFLVLKTTCLNSSLIV
jgi:hypothetical protein